jgi:hypothetical protein
MLILIMGACTMWKWAVADVSEELPQWSGLKWGVLCECILYKPSIYITLLTSSLIMEAVCSSETSATQPNSTRCKHPKAGSASTMIQCKNSAFRDEPRRILKVIQCFGKHCSYHLQAEYSSWRWQLQCDFQHSTRLIPESRSFTMDSSRENLTRIKNDLPWKIKIGCFSNYLTMFYKLQTYRIVWEVMWRI